MSEAGGRAWAEAAGLGLGGHGGEAREARTTLSVGRGPWKVWERAGDFVRTKEIGAKVPR
jgi:hypothetical protein